MKSILIFKVHKGTHKTGSQLRVSEATLALLCGRVGVYLLHFGQFWLAEQVLLEEEVVCLVSEFLLEAEVQVVLATVEDELFWITTLDLTKLTGDGWTAANLGGGRCFLLASSVASLVHPHHWV